MSSSRVGEAAVGRGHQAVLQVVEVVAVGVPEVLAVVVPVDRHQRDARLDQASAEQEALAVDVPAVGVAEPRVLAVDAERRPGPRPRRGRRRRGPGGRTTRPGRRRSAEPSPRRRWRRASIRSGVMPSGRVRPPTLEAGGVRVALDGERVERLAEPAGVLPGGPAAGGRGVGDGPGHRHARRQRRPLRRPDLRHDRAEVRPILRRGAARRRNTAAGRGGRSAAGGRWRGGPGRRGSSTGRSPASPSAARASGNAR